MALERITFYLAQSGYVYVCVWGCDGMKLENSGLKNQEIAAVILDFEEYYSTIS